MKKRLFKITCFILLLISILQTNIFANTLRLDIKADKEEIKIGDEIKITVDWKTGMQAADFYLKYDSKKLEYVSSDLEEHFINNENGIVKTAWFSLDDVDKTEIEYTFRALKSGQAIFETEIKGGFATGNLRIPNKYENDKITIKILGNPMLIIVSAVIVIVIIFIIIIKKNNTQKKKGIIKHR